MFWPEISAKEKSAWPTSFAIQPLSRRQSASQHVKVTVCRVMMSPLSAHRVVSPTVFSQNVVALAKGEITIDDWCQCSALLVEVNFGGGVGLPLISDHFFAPDTILQIPNADWGHWSPWRVANNRGQLLYLPKDNTFLQQLGDCAALRFASRRKTLFAVHKFFPWEASSVILTSAFLCFGHP